MRLLIRGLWPCVNSNVNLSATFQLPDKHLDKRMKQVVSWSNSFPFLVTNPWEPEKRAIKHFPVTFMKQWSAVFRKFFVVVENGNENIWSNNISFKLLFWILFSLFILSICKHLYSFAQIANISHSFMVTVYRRSVPWKVKRGKLFNNVLKLLIPTFDFRGHKHKAILYLLCQSLAKSRFLVWIVKDRQLSINNNVEFLIKLTFIDFNISKNIPTNNNLSWSSFVELKQIRMKNRSTL